MDAEQYYHEVASKVSGSVSGQLFGKPCYKLGKKAFCCFFQDEMVFKLRDEAHMNALQLSGAKLFDPSGKKRPMKEWVQVPFEHKDLWMNFATAAAEYIGT